MSKKSYKKVIFSLTTRPLPPPPSPLMALPLRKDLFLGFPKRLLLFSQLLFFIVDPNGKKSIIEILVALL